jgi:5'(3')-deoxyribonucleotidase
LRIAVDLDGVLAETMTRWCEKANEEFGTRLKLDDLDSWASWVKLGVSKDKFYRLLDEAWDDWERVPPTEPGIAEKVARVQAYGEVDIVTGRSRRTVEGARNWLSHYKVPFGRFVRVPGVKDKIFLDYDVYIDDAPDLMHLISKNPVMHGILYERPWNRDLRDLRGVSRVKKWKEVPGVLKKIIH